MTKLLSIDFYKIFRTKSFYVIAFIASALAVLFSSTSTSACVSYYNEYASLYGSNVPSGSTPFGTAWYTIFSNVSILGLLGSILAAMFLCSEFSYGTIKNIASKGYRREDIYLSKLFTCVSGLFFNFVLTFVVSYVTCLIAGGNRIPNFFKFSPDILLLPILFVFLFLAVEVSLALMIASLVRKSGASIGIYVVVNSISSYLFNVIDSKLFKETLHWDFKISDYTYAGCLSQIGFSEAMKSNDILRFACVVVGFFVLTIGIGIFYFRKRDI